MTTLEQNCILFSCMSFDLPAFTVLGGDVGYIVAESPPLLRNASIPDDFESQCVSNVKRP